MIGFACVIVCCVSTLELPLPVATGYSPATVFLSYLPPITGRGRVSDLLLTFLLHLIYSFLELQKKFWRCFGGDKRPLC